MKHFITNEPLMGLKELGRDEHTVLSYRFGKSHSISETRLINDGALDCYICYYYIPRDEHSYYLCVNHSICEVIDEIIDNHDKVKLLPHLFPTINTLLRNAENRCINKPFLVHTVAPDNPSRPCWFIAVVVNEEYNLQTLIGDISQHPDMIKKADLLFNAVLSITQDWKQFDARVNEIRKEHQQGYLNMALSLLSVVAKVTRVLSDSLGTLDTSGLELDVSEINTSNMASFDSSLGQDISFTGCSYEDHAIGLYDSDISLAQDNLDTHTTQLANSTDITETKRLSDLIKQDRSDLEYWKSCQNDAIATAKQLEASAEYRETMYEIASRHFF